VTFVEGNPLQVTDDNLVSLQDFRQQFGFDALSAECASFEELHANVCENSMLLHKSGGIARLSGAEERQLLLERLRLSAIHLQILPVVFQYMVKFLSVNRLIIIVVNIYIGRPRLCNRNDPSER
jgi:hypothetical protein